MQNCLVLSYLCKETHPNSLVSAGTEGAGSGTGPALPVTQSCLSPASLQGAQVHPHWSSCHDSVISLRKMDCRRLRENTVTATHGWGCGRQTSATVSSSFSIFPFSLLSTSAAAAEPPEIWVNPVVPGGTAQRAAALNTPAAPPSVPSLHKVLAWEGWAPSLLLSKQHHPAVQSRLTLSILIFCTFRDDDVTTNPSSHWPPLSSLFAERE